MCMLISQNGVISIDLCKTDVHITRSHNPVIKLLKARKRNMLLFSFLEVFPIRLL